MRMSNGRVGIAIAVVCLWSGSASAFRWTPMPDRDRERISTLSSRTAPTVLALLPAGQRAALGRSQLPAASKVALHPIEFIGPSALVQGHHLTPKN